MKTIAGALEGRYENRSGLANPYPGARFVMKKSKHMISDHSESVKRFDRLMPDERSKLMSRIRSKDTKPELAVRKIVFSLGYRYRLHRTDLPGKPDLVFPGKKKVIFVHGCFWHGHNCDKGRLPKSRPEYWEPKIARNRQRDAEKNASLIRAGWAVLVVWECELRSTDALKVCLTEFLRETSIYSFVLTTIQRPGTLINDHQ